MVWKIVFVLMLASCGYKFPLGYPTKNNFLNKAPDGPPAFQYGWAQGCKTGAAPFVSLFYGASKSVGWEKDYKFAEQSPDYEIGWQTAFWYCSRKANRIDGLRGNKYRGL